MHTRESIAKELKRIQESVPDMFKTFLFEEKDLTPDMKLVAEKAIEGDLPEEKRKHVQMLLDEGYFSKKKIFENPKVAKQRDIWVQKEIKKAVKEGRLPTRKQLKELEAKDHAHN